MLTKDIGFSSELQDLFSMAARFRRIKVFKALVESAKFLQQAAHILSRRSPTNSSFFEPDEPLHVKEYQPQCIYDWELPKDPFFGKFIMKLRKEKTVYIWRLLFINSVPYLIGGGRKFSMALKFRGSKREAGVPEVV
jgi:hypothetical protein